MYLILGAWLLNSHASGMAVARPYSFEIEFVINCITETAAWFFVIILKFIFTRIYEIKIYEKKFLDTKKKFILKADFHKSTYIFIKSQSLAWLLQW